MFVDKVSHEKTSFFVSCYKAQPEKMIRRDLASRLFAKDEVTK